MYDRDVAIVGMGCAFPKARNLREYWRNVANGVNCLTGIPSGRLRHLNNFALPADHEARFAMHRGGFLPSDLTIDPKAYGLLPNAVKNGDPDQFLMLLVVEEALRDAKLGRDDARREKTDVILGRGGYPGAKHVELSLRAENFDATLELIDRKYPEILADGRYRDVDAWLRSSLPVAETDSLSSAIPNIVASRIANRFDLGGLAVAVDGACASSLLALEQAIDRLRNRRCDASIVAGCFLNQNSTFLLVFNQLHAVSASGMIRPMDRRADGLLMGEGCGAVVLKRLEDAIADHDQIYAIVKGCGSSSDGRNLDVLAPAWQGQIRAVDRAYEDAGVDRDRVSYLELHGTGTLAGDAAEMTTVQKMFGTSKHPPTGRAMGSVKSQIGHLMPASGIAALIRTALALSNKVLPPSLNCEEPREEVYDSQFYVNSLTRPWVQNESHGPRYAAINSFGFGGVNVHTVLEEALPVPAKKKSKTKPLQTRPVLPGVDRPSELAVFAAADVGALQQQLSQLQAFLSRDQQPFTAADVSRSLAAGVNFKLPVKLGIVFESLSQLRGQLHTVTAELAKCSPQFTDEAIYFSRDASHHTGKIAFMFPGMGFPGLIGNYPDHIFELCLHYPELRGEFDFFEDRDRHPDDDIPTSSVFVPPASLPEAYRAKLKGRLAPPKVDVDFTDEPRPEERYLAAMGVTLVNWISWRLLEMFQFPVDVATGQSQGEMAAVCAVGLGNFRESAPAYWKVLNVTPKYSQAGRLAFVWATEEQVAPLVAQNPGTHIAIYMAPSAIILGGERDGLIRITEELKKQQCLTQILPYPAIHTPMLSYLNGELEEALKDEKFAINKPTIDLYSSITSELYPTDMVGVRRTIMLNLDHPLRVWQTVQRMYNDGARIFVQVGGGHMSAHMKQLMPVGEEAITTALDVDTRNPITQLNHLVATLFVAGVPFNLDPLFEHRETNVLNLAAPRETLAKPKMQLPIRMDWSPLDHALVSYRDRRPAAVLENATSAAGPTSASLTENEKAPVEQAERASIAAGVPLPAAQEPAPAPVETTAPGPVVLADDFEQQPAVVQLDAPLPILRNANITEYQEGVSLKIERVLDAVVDRYILDHLFVYCPPRDPRDCLPIVPMTMSIEFIAETAALLCPGLGVIGFENVRAMRWVALEDRYRTLLHLEAQLVSVDETTGERRVDVTMSYEGKRAFSGRVVFGAQYPVATPMAWPELPADAVWPFHMDEVYGERRMFHGPSFQVISRIDQFSNPVASGALRVLPKHELFADLPEPALLMDPCLLDGIGQMVGLWCQGFDWFILPTGVEKVEVFGPTPPVGTDCPIRMVVTQFDVELKQLKANFEIEDGQGRVWMRLSNWGDWIFKWTAEFFNFNRAPHTFLAASECLLPRLSSDAVAVQMEERHLMGVDLMWVARTALTDAELAEFRLIEGKKVQRRFLMSKLAAKDAVRLWRQRSLNEPLRHPAEYAIEHDAAGRPIVVGIFDGIVPQITVAHKDNLVVAVAAAESLGIDLEPAGRETRSLLDSFATPAEVELISPLVEVFPDGAWETRLWCAKEAAGKARGTGLNGYPKRLQVLEADEDGRMVVQDTETTSLYEVQTSSLADFLVATATPMVNTTGSMTA